MKDTYRVVDDFYREVNSTMLFRDKMFPKEFEARHVRLINAALSYNVEVRRAFKVFESIHMAYNLYVRMETQNHGRYSNEKLRIKSLEDKIRGTF